MKKFFIWLGVIGIVLAVFSFAIYIFISELLDTEPVVQSDSYIQMRLGGTIPEYNMPDVYQEYLGTDGLNLQKIRKSFRMAAVDDRIKGIVLRLGFVQTGFAKLEDIKQMIHSFQQSGKKVIAHLELGLIRDYYLASFCDSVFLQPGGTIFLNGLAFEVTFYKDFFRKIGVEADFVHIGKYKNAPDVYTRQTMSEPQREVLNEILDYRIHQIVSGISESRGIDEQKLYDIIDNVSALTGEEAQDFGLIDGIGYADTIPRILDHGAEELDRISLNAYSRIKPQSVGLEEGPRMAVVYCVGTISGGEDGNDPFFGNTVGASRVVRNIRAAAESKSVKAIIVRIDSPGGSSIDSDIIWHAVDQASLKKPVIASISDLGASGGYYVALGADRILAQPGSLIGSIGIYGGKFSIDSLYQFLGLNTVSLQRGKNARMFSLTRSFSSEERKVLRKTLNHFYDLFIKRVATAREIDQEQVRRHAQGRVWTGDRGLEINLIDQIGGLDQAIEVAKELAGIDSTEDVRLSYYPRKKSFLSQLLRTVSYAKARFINPVKMIEESASRIQGKPLALMPYILKIQ